MYAEEAKKYQIAMVECQKSNKVTGNNQMIKEGQKWSWKLHIGLSTMQSVLFCWPY